MNELHDAVLVILAAGLLLALALRERSYQSLRDRFETLEAINDHWRDVVVRLETSRRWLLSELGNPKDAIDEVKQ